MLEHLLRLFGLAAVDSVNLLAFAVIAGLWISSQSPGAMSRTGHFLPRAARFTGGAFCGILLLAAASVWLIGANLDVVRPVLNSSWAMVLLMVLGIGITILGFRAPAQAKEENLEAPLAHSALQRLGIAATGVGLGVIQSATSVPFAAGVVLISFAEEPIWAQAVQIVFFGLVAITPSVLLIVVLSRIHTSKIASAVAVIDRLMTRGRRFGRYLTIAIGLTVVGFAIVRMLFLAGTG